MTVHLLTPLPHAESSDLAPNLLGTAPFSDGLQFPSFFLGCGSSGNSPVVPVGFFQVFAPLRFSQWVARISTVCFRKSYTLLSESPKAYCSEARTHGVYSNVCWQGDGRIGDVLLLPRCTHR